MSTLNHPRGGPPPGGGLAGPLKGTIFHLPDLWKDPA
jgi:hypothetical protein